MKVQDWSELDLESLQVIYDNQTEHLQMLLLKGVPWEDTKDLRDEIAQVSVQLYKHLNPHHFDNPAEKKNRRQH